MDLTESEQENLRQLLVFDWGAPEEIADYPFIEGVLAERQGIRVKNIEALPLGGSEPEEGWWMETRATIGIRGNLVHFGWDVFVRTIGYAV